MKLTGILARKLNSAWQTWVSRASTALHEHNRFHTHFVKLSVFSLMIVAGNNERKRNDQRQVKRKRTTRSDKLEEYKEHYKNALVKLMKTDPYDPIEAKLTVTQCAAVLSLGFGKYTPSSGKKRAAIRADVKEEIDKNESDKPFWKDIRID